MVSSPNIRSPSGFSSVLSFADFISGEYIYDCFSAWLTRVSECQTHKPGSEMLTWPTYELHTMLNVSPLEVCKRSRQHFYNIFESWVSFACRAFFCTCFNSALHIWLNVICFVSWWWAPVIHGGSPGHLRSTAVDSSEIKRSSRSVTMSSLRSWLGCQPSKPGRWGGFMNFNWGHKCEHEWKLHRGLN